MICNVNLTVEYKLEKLRLSVFNAMLRVRDDIGGHNVRPGEYPQGGQTEPVGHQQTNKILHTGGCSPFGRMSSIRDLISFVGLHLIVVLVRQFTSEQIDLKIRC